MSKLLTTIHKKIAIEAIKKLAKTSCNNEARFVFDEKDRLYAADGYNFTHGDICEEYHCAKIGAGYVRYYEITDTYLFSIYRFTPWNPKLFKKFEKHNITYCGYIFEEDSF
jgi:hypothetical protein